MQATASSVNLGCDGHIPVSPYFVLGVRRPIISRTDNTRHITELFAGGGLTQV
jgi:hypothetical protein